MRIEQNEKSSLMRNKGAQLCYKYNKEKLPP